MSPADPRTPARRTSTPPPWAGRHVTKARAKVAAATTWPTPCARCGGPVLPTWWHLGHRLDRQAYPELTWEPSNWQVEHPHCSSSAGASQGNQRRRHAEMQGNDARNDLFRNGMEFGPTRPDPNCTPFAPLTSAEVPEK